VIEVDVADYLLSQFGENVKVSQAYLKSVGVGGIKCPGAAATGAGPVVTTIISDQLSPSSGLLITDIFLRSVENMGQEFVTFGVQESGNFIADYSSISGSLLNITASLAITAKLSPGGLFSLVCSNYSGLPVALNPSGVAQTQITIVGFVQGYRFNSPINQSRSGRRLAIVTDVATGAVSPL